jgi:ABC-2 type transport system ATP-binding protein
MASTTAQPPMVRVSHLTRRYGRTLAVDDLSFEVGRGEIVGFLGPNGAGKTTTLRILCGFLAATSGEVEIAGFDVHTDSLEARRHIGYLPERCPLYTDMRVDEFLRFRAALKGVSARQVRERVEAVKEQCGLSEVGRRLIGQLSKGYCQRVGLADVLVHDPELLVLDEPTIGLDPAQIRQVRDLIRELATRHTVLLSTHILTEVEAVCRRVLILNRGRLVASDSTDRLCQLRRGIARVTAEVRGPPEEVRAAFSALSGVRSAVVETEGEWCRVRLECAGGADPRPDIFRAAVARGWTLREVGMAEQRLEDVFIELTAPEEGPREEAERSGT